MLSCPHHCPNDLGRPRAVPRRLTHITDLQGKRATAGHRLPPKGTAPADYELDTRTFGTTTAEHLALLLAEQHDARRWAATMGGQNCRHLSRRLEHDLLGVGEHVRRVARQADGPRAGLGC